VLELRVANCANGKKKMKCGLTKSSGKLVTKHSKILFFEKVSFALLKSGKRGF
jgi:hypothetical protein